MNQQVPQEQETVAYETAKVFLDTESILFNATSPFTYTSGRVGPVYINARRLISIPSARKQVMEYASNIIQNIGTFDVLAGGETAGIPYAAFLAEKMDAPMVYIRKKPKGYGNDSQIEGLFEKEQRAILIEDIQNYGKSSTVFIEAMRKAGLKINDLVVLFKYGISDIPEKIMNDLDMRIHALTEWKTVLSVARDQKYFDDKTLEEVESFLNDPVTWSLKNGGKEENQEEIKSA